MARITIIPESEARGDLRNLYTRIAGQRGVVADVLKIHSLLPETMQDHFQLYTTLMFRLRKTGLTRDLLEMIAVIVSATNHCEYCLAHHSESLSRLLKDPPLLKALQTLDWSYLTKTLKLPQLSVLMLARKITTEPHRVSEDDLKKLRKYGYQDEQLLHLILVMSYFNFVNRNVLALGLELEPDFQDSCR